MTAKEKAIELIEKFKPHVNPYMGSGMLSNTHDDDAILYQAKQCAIKAVDEMIKAFDTPSLRLIQKYWREVKQEIDQL